MSVSETAEAEKTCNDWLWQGGEKPEESDIATTLAKWADDWAGAREAGMDVLATNFIDQIIELAQAARDA